MLGERKKFGDGNNVRKQDTRKCPNEEYWKWWERLSTAKPKHNHVPAAMNVNKQTGW